MRSFFAHHLRETNWLLLAILSLAFLQLSPVLRTGYLGDDAGNSLIHGILQYHGYSLSGYCCQQCQRWLCDVARFYPLVFPQIYGTFYLFPSLIAYKCWIIALVIMDLFFYARLVRMVTKWDGFPELVTLVVLGLIQFSWSDDPILGYAGLLPEILLLTILSLTWLWHYFDTGKRYWLIGSVASYAIALLTYEISYPFFLLHLALARSRQKQWRSVLATCLPFVAAALFCVAVSLLLRWQLGISPSSPYRVSPHPRPYAWALIRQLDGSLPLSHWRGRQLVDPPFRLREWVSPASTTRILGALILTLAALGRLARTAPAAANLPCRRVAALGLALWLLPALLVCSSLEYQNRIRWGMPQISIYIAFYGAGLIMALVIACVLVRLPANRSRLVFAGLTSSLLAATLAWTYHANHEAINYFSRGWRDERLNMEAALKAGLVEEIPDHSTLLVQHAYPWWHDRYIGYFYQQHTGKKFHFSSFTPGSADQFGPSDPSCANGKVFVLLDGASDQRSGYVLLTTGDEPSAVRLFIRGQARGLPSPDGTITLAGRKAAPQFSAAGLEVIRQGSGWALYRWPITPDTLSRLIRGS